ncbi:MarR family winged helix-turn-helix transcriptional regulator [Gordonia sp. VNK1]|uniref:MarR family winged helix-turn-helix transcriptional regulator n=1 Tax=Gordonia oleivorans TaxID=3156618 RepID=UPI0032B60922
MDGENVDDDHAPWPSPLYRDLVEELSRLHRRKGQYHVDSILEGSAFAILLVLSDGRPRTLRNLAEDLDLEQSTVNRQVNAAIKLGYLERFDVEGSLSRMVRPTDAGQTAFHHDGMLRVRRLERVFADLAPGEPDVLLRELQAFNEAYDRALRAETRADGDHRRHG